MDLLEETIQDYRNLDKRVIKYLNYVITEINKDKITDYTKAVLSMLVPQLIIYYKSLDELNNADGLTNENKYYGKSKSPVIIIMQKANDQILNLLDKISLSPLSKAKVKKLNENPASREESATELFNDLVS